MENKTRLIRVLWNSRRGNDVVHYFVRQVSGGFEWAEVPANVYGTQIMEQGPPESMLFNPTQRLPSHTVVRTFA